MSNGDDEPESDDGADAPREDDGAAGQPAAEEIGAAESSTASDEDETAQEIAAQKDDENGAEGEDETEEPDAGAEDATDEDGSGSEDASADDESEADDGGEDADEPPGEADEEEQLEADEEQAEKAEEASESGDDADVEPPDDAEGETEDTADEAPDAEDGTEDAESETGDEDEESATDDDEDADETADEEDADDAASEDEDTDGDADEGGESDEDQADEGDEGGEGDAESEDEAEDAVEKHTVESLEERLDSTAEQVEQAETEDELDRAETAIEEIEEDIEAADLPEDAEEDGDDEEEAEPPQERLESRVAELRETVEEKRGPYADEVIEEIEGAQSTIEETRWTEQGRSEVVAAVSEFLDAIEDPLGESFSAGEDVEDQPPVLGEVIEAVESAGLDPDQDTETIASLLAAAEELTEDLEVAEEWDDLTVRQKLDAEGFYSVLTPENRKDFPPEWNAVKIYERRGEPEPILMALDMLGSEFMDDNCIESLKRMGAPEAYDAMEQRAQRRDKAPIEVLGKIGDDRALETLHEYIEGESDPALQKVTLKAIGEIGSEDSTQAVADRLVADNETVRSTAARALGLIGDTRAIGPLADVLDDDDSDSVRASAAWSLNRIGTEKALDAAREHADDRSYLVQSEAERAASAMSEEDDTAEQAA